MPRFQVPVRARQCSGAEARRRQTRIPTLETGLDPEALFEGEALAIELTYRRALSGLSHLSRRDRAAIAKATRARRQGALRALMEKRAAARRMKKTSRQSQAPPAP